MNRQGKPGLIPPELRTAAIVPRWSIVWTLNRDIVTNHSWFVAMYSYEIAKMIDWDGRFDALLYLALTHDLDETITGDIVSPVKREIVDDRRAEEYIRAKMWERLPNVMKHIDGLEIQLAEDHAMFSDEAWAIIKIADRLDALLFLLTEKRMGNGVIEPRLPSAEAQLVAAWDELPVDKDRRDELWATFMVPTINAHKQLGGYGV